MVCGAVKKHFSQSTVSMFLFKQLQLHPVEGIVVGSFPGAPLADPVHGEDRDAGIVLSRILVDCKKDAFRFGFCEAFIEAVRVDEKGFPRCGDWAIRNRAGHKKAIRQKPYGTQDGSGGIRTHGRFPVT